ncbi:hypothetical protein VCB98_13590, partial [Gammaproteobacteria bacterium AB-CW1]|nr:hypothetical protein [Gammaproteobacteria bacterium AB-CW1]
GFHVHISGDIYGFRLTLQGVNGIVFPTGCGELLPSKAAHPCLTTPEMVVFDQKSVSPSQASIPGITNYRESPPTWL